MTAVSHMQQLLQPWQLHSLDSWQFRKAPIACTWNVNRLRCCRESIICSPTFLHQLLSAHMWPPPLPPPTHPRHIQLSHTHIPPPNPPPTFQSCHVLSHLWNHCAVTVPRARALSHRTGFASATTLRRHRHKCYAMARKKARRKQVWAL